MENFIKSKLKFSFKLYFKLFQIFFLFNQIKSECDRNAPIFILDGGCKLEFCEKSQFESKICEIKNPIIKTQWLNNIIKVGDSTFRYVNFGLFSNGDMLLRTTCFPGTTIRKYYGLKQNGRPFFKENNEETAFNTIEVNNADVNYESESIVINHVLYGQEFLLSASKLGSYAEIFSSGANEAYVKPVTDFSNSYISSDRNSFYAFPTSYSNYYYLFAFLGSFLDDFWSKYVFFQKHQEDFFHTLYTY